jgi:hypothetical protein
MCKAVQHFSLSLQHAHLRYDEPIGLSQLRQSLESALERVSGFPAGFEHVPRFD